MKRRIVVLGFVWLLTIITINAQNVNQNRVLAPGNPPLTTQMVNDLIDFFEWTLDAKFTQADRNQFLNDRISEWRANDQTSVNSVMELLKLRAQVASLTESQKAQAHTLMQSSIVESLRSTADDSTSRMLLKIYEHSQHEHSVIKNNATTAGVANEQGQNVPSELIGKWQTGSVSSVNFVNPRTGAYAPPSGTQVMYTIFPDGRYEYAALTQQSMYNCTTKLFTYKTGTIKINNTSLTFIPKQGKFTSEDNCNSKYNYEKQIPLERETFNWKITRDEYGEKICLQNGSINGCAYKR